MGDGATAHDACRQFAQCPRADLQLVACQLRHQTFGRLLVEAPVDEALQFGRGYVAPPVAIAVPEGVHGVDVAEEVLMHEVHHLDVARVEEALLAGEEDAPRLQMTAVEGPRLFHRVGNSFLAVHMLSCVEGIHCYLVVGV